MLGLSYRQTKRLWRRFRRRGARGLPASAVRAGRRIGDHGGDACSARWRLIRAEIQRRRGDAVRADAGGRAPGERRRRCTVDHETLRRWMLAAGLWSRRAEAVALSPASRAEGAFRRAGATRWQLSRRGMKIAGPRRCLITMVDDATESDAGRFSDAGNDLGGGGGAAARGSSSTACRRPSTPTGRTSMCGPATDAETHRQAWCR